MSSSAFIPSNSYYKKLRSEEPQPIQNGPQLPYDRVSSMPTEIILNIFSYLGAQELLQASLVSKFFYLHANDNSLWKRMKIEGAPHSVVINKRVWVSLTQMLSTEIPHSEFNHFFSKMINNGLFSKKVWKTELKEKLGEYEVFFNEKPNPKISAPYAFSKAQVLTFIFTISAGWPIKQMEILTYKEWKFLKGYEGVLAKIFLIYLVVNPEKMKRKEPTVLEILKKIPEGHDREICSKLLMKFGENLPPTIFDLTLNSWKINSLEKPLNKNTWEDFTLVTKDYLDVFPDHLTRMLLARVNGHLPDAIFYQASDQHLAPPALFNSIRKELRLFVMKPGIDRIPKTCIHQAIGSILGHAKISIKEFIDQKMLSKEMRALLYQELMKKYFYSYYELDNKEDSLSYLCNMKEHLIAEPSLDFVVTIFKYLIDECRDSLITLLQLCSKDDPTFIPKVLKYIDQEDPLFLKPFINIIKNDFAEYINTFEAA